MPEPIKNFRAKTHPSVVPARSQDFETFGQAIDWLNSIYCDGYVQERAERGEWFNRVAVKAGKIVPFPAEIPLKEKS